MNTATEDADTQGHTFHSSTLQATLQRREKHWTSCSGPNGFISSHAIGGIAPANAESKNITPTIDDCHRHTVFEPRLNWMYLNGTTWSIRLEPHVVRLENHGLPPRCCLSVAFLPNGARRPNRLQSPRHHRKDRWLPPRRCLRIALFSMALDNRIDIGCVSAIAIFSVICCKRIHTVTESITSRNDEYHGDTLAN
jgi:hypothetical protein